MKIQAVHTQKHLKYNVPDGGWGWIVVLGSTIIMSLVNNLHVSYGVMFSGWYNERDVSSTMVGIILNTNCVLWTLMYLFAGPLTETIGWRSLGIVSTSMTALSLILSAFATSTTELLFSYSILGGIFGGLSIGQVYIILPKYFDKHLGVANALPMAGFSVCQFVFPILIPYLQDQYLYKGTMLLLGGIVLHAVAAAALFQPPEWHKIIVYDENSNAIKVGYQNQNYVVTKEKGMLNIINAENANSDKEVNHPPINLESEETSLLEKICKDIVCVLKAIVKNLAILKKPSALIISLGFSLFVSSSINYYGLVPFLIVNAGYSIEDAGWVISYGATANILARLSSGIISDFVWFKVPIGYVSGTSMSLVAMVGFALTDNFLCFTLFSVMQGFGHGAHMGLFSIVTKEIVGPDLHSASIGASGVMLSMGFLTLGPFLGLLKDLSGSFTATLIFMAVLNFISVLLWLLMPLAKSFEIKQNNATDN